MVVFSTFSVYGQRFQRMLYAITQFQISQREGAGAREREKESLENKKKETFSVQKFMKSFSVVFIYISASIRSNNKFFLAETNEALQ